MQRTTVSSSNVASIGWENGTLEVEFTSGAVYQYSRVPEQVYKNFLDSGASAGRYFVTFIRGAYDYTKGLNGKA